MLFPLLFQKHSMWKRNTSSQYSQTLLQNGVQQYLLLLPPRFREQWSRRLFVSGWDQLTASGFVNGMHVSEAVHRSGADISFSQPSLDPPRPV
jgi:hypothetical protein